MHLSRHCMDSEKKKFRTNNIFNLRLLKFPRNENGNFSFSSFGPLDWHILAEELTKCSRSHMQAVGETVGEGAGSSCSPVVCKQSNIIYQLNVIVIKTSLSISKESVARIQRIRTKRLNAFHCSVCLHPIHVDPHVLFTCAVCRRSYSY